MEDANDTFGHFSEFQHLSNPDIENPESADLGYKFLVEDIDYPALVLYVSVKREGHDLVTFKYGLLRDRWDDITQAKQLDARKLLNLASSQVSQDLLILKNGATPTSAEAVEFL